MKTKKGVDGGVGTGVAADSGAAGAGQAQAQLESIREMVAHLRTALEADNEVDVEAAREIIQTDPLSVEYRADWHEVDVDTEDVEYKILLSWGGPAVRITGDLGAHGEPKTARLEYQDWGTPWTEYRLDVADEEILIEYAECLCYER